MPITIEVTITPESHEDVVKVMETLVRVSTGLVFDGIDVDINISNWEPIKQSIEEEEES